MSDQRDCTHPTPETTSTTPGADLGPPAAFREALLWRLENPTAVLLLRRFGEVLFEIMDEAGQFGHSAVSATYSAVSATVGSTSAARRAGR